MVGACWRFGYNNSVAAAGLGVSVCFGSPSGQGGTDVIKPSDRSKRYRW